MMRRIIAVTVAWIAWAGPLSADTDFAGNPLDFCAPEVDRAFGPFGLKVADLLEVKWIIDRRQSEATLPDFLQPIGGYRLYARPPQCEKGRLAVYMRDTCIIDDIRTRSGCRIAGIREGWLP